MPTKKPRLISDEPRLLNLIDDFLPKTDLGKIAIPFAKDLMKNVRNRQNLIDTLGFVVRINVFDAILKKIIGA